MSSSQHSSPASSKGRVKEWFSKLLSRKHSQNVSKPSESNSRGPNLASRGEAGQARALPGGPPSTAQRQGHDQVERPANIASSKLVEVPLSPPPVRPNEVSAPVETLNNNSVETTHPLLKISTTRSQFENSAVRNEIEKLSSKDSHALSLSHSIVDSISPKKTLESSTVRKTFENPVPKKVFESPIPSAVPCRLVVYLDGRRFPHFEEARLVWNDQSQFHVFQNAAARILSDMGNFNPLDDSGRLYKRAGRCRLVRREDDFEVESRIIENEKQWATFLPLMVAKFAADNNYVEFYLELRWEYSLLIIRREVGVSYAQTIKGVLYDRMKRNYRGQKYVPRQVLDNVFRSSTVRELIDQDRSLDRLAAALLIETGHPLDIDAFFARVIESGIVYLALCIYTDIPLECLYRLMERYKECDAILKIVDCPKGISKPQFDHLVELQGCFRAHTFDDDKGRPVHRPLHDSIVVPIMFDESKDLIGSGGFGEVFRIQIDPDHHQFSPNRDTVYALKRFHARDLTKNYFEKESKALRALAKVPHPNITLHLASWTQDGRFYMIFPCAETSLKSHLSSAPAPELRKEFVLFLLTQMRDLAAAVEHIHIVNLNQNTPKSKTVVHVSGGNLPVAKVRRYRHTGYHYDLKPDNVLIFQRDKKMDPIWRLSDFGTTEIHEVVATGSQQPHVTHRVENSGLGDPEYGAPDFAYQQWSSRPYDIWSLGCIFLEVLLWTFGWGGSELRDFEWKRLNTSDSRSNQSTAFWYRDRNSNLKLKPAVVQKLRDLRSCCESRGVFKDLVTLTGNMLTLVPNERPEASSVRAALNALLLQANNDLEDEKCYLGTVAEREVLVKPATAVRSPSRPESIDLRSVTASPVTPDRSSPSHPGLGEHRRSFSEPVAKALPLPSSDKSDYEFVGQHFSQLEVPLPRSRSPSFSIVSPDGDAREVMDADFESRPIVSYRNPVSNQDILK